MVRVFNRPMGNNFLFSPLSTQNILTKVTYPPEFEVSALDEEDPFSVMISTLAENMVQVKVSLRSVLTEDDEEEEIVPHVKGSFDFEIYKPVNIKSNDLVLPWDDTTKQTINAHFKVYYTFITHITITTSVITIRSPVGICP